MCAILKVIAHLWNKNKRRELNSIRVILCVPSKCSMNGSSMVCSSTGTMVDNSEQQGTWLSYRLHLQPTP
ncbi:hypothetical protein Y032_0138g2060 [Ancylostoma ceylanicum]|uniref:Uncharacterized protein n=1 Tax=Ancylostoma ceylanicum TaxID=53326 RepID=A0A016T4Y4_9BILA|nr:hypothetical protein Y032_0138g2060 [Ancylostoma ceylanicum]